MNVVVTRQMCSKTLVQFLKLYDLVKTFKSWCLASQRNKKKLLTERQNQRGTIQLLFRKL